MPNQYHAYDARLAHRAPAQVALTANTTLATVTQRTPMRTAYLTRLNLEAIKTSAGNELYTILVEGSNDGFATFESLAVISLGHTSVRLGGPRTNAAGELVDRMWSTEQGNAVYQDWRIRLIVAGTAPSISVSAYSTVMPGA